MGYAIELQDPVTHEVLWTDAPLRPEKHLYRVGGMTELRLGVTYNYADWYYKPGVFPSFPDEEFSNGRSGIRSIYHMTGAESIPVLKHAIAELEAMTEDLTDEEIREHEAQGTSGYWLPTRENAIKPLYQLLAFAEVRPDGVWEGD